jgi:replicative DNA helicase
MEMLSKARQLQMQHGLDLLIIDYLQLMSAGRRIENKVQEITEISKGLKTLAKELKIPIIALSQLSRAMEKASGGRRRPQLSDLRESGSIEQDADTVIFLYEDDPADDTELIIGKQRNGPTGMVRLRFLRQYNKFAEITEREEAAASGYE